MPRSSIVPLSIHPVACAIADQGECAALKVQNVSLPAILRDLTLRGVDWVDRTKLGGIMAGKVVVGAAVLAVAFQVLLACVARAGLLGHGDTQFLRYAYGTAMTVMITTIAAVAAVGLGYARYINAWAVASTVVLAILSVVMFLGQFL